MFINGSTVVRNFVYINFYKFLRSPHRNFDKVLFNPHKLRNLCSSHDSDDSTDIDVSIKKTKKLSHVDFVNQKSDVSKPKSLKNKKENVKSKKVNSIIDEVKAETMLESKDKDFKPPLKVIENKKIRSTKKLEKSKNVEETSTLSAQSSLSALMTAEVEVEDFMNIFQDSLTRDPAFIINDSEPDNDITKTQVIKVDECMEEEDVISQKSLIKKEQEFEAKFEPSKKQKLFEKIDMRIKGYDPEVMASYLEFIKMVCQNLDLETSQIHYEMRNYFLNNSLRSIFAYKNHRVQYEVRTYKRGLTFYRLTEQSANTLLTYLQYNLPEGIAMEVDYKYVEPLPKYMC